MASLFDTLQAQAYRAGVQARTTRSQRWFKSKVQDLKIPGRRALLKDDRLEQTDRTIWGHMYMYFYDPKLKQELPYYDRFPLTIAVQPAPGGFYGLNLHYLNYNVRAKFLDALMETAPGNMTDRSRLRMRYDLLAKTRKYKEFKPCFKHYLTNHVKSRFARVPMSEWEIAIFLPVEEFKKSDKRKVWSDSLRIARS